jgi:hypothetical protein
LLLVLSFALISVFFIFKSFDIVVAPILAHKELHQASLPLH